jgi:hypothetical protein
MMSARIVSAAYVTRAAALAAAATLVAGLLAGPADASQTSSNPTQAQNRMLCMSFGRYSGCVTPADLRSTLPHPGAGLACVRREQGPDQPSTIARRWTAVSALIVDQQPGCEDTVELIMY